MSELNFTNWSMRRDSQDDRDWYDWCVFLDASVSQLAIIELVEYVLHPTFPNPIRRIRDSSSKFALFSDGWGEFNLDIRIVFRDGATGKQRYSLTLRDDNWPKPHAAQPGSQSEKDVLSILTDSEYRWRKITTVIRKLGNETERAKQGLDQLYTRGLARKAHFESVDGIEMWGATARVGLSPAQL